MSLGLALLLLPGRAYAEAAASQWEVPAEVASELAPEVAPEAPDASPDGSDGPRPEAPDASPDLAPDARDGAPPDAPPNDAAIDAPRPADAGPDAAAPDLGDDDGCGCRVGGASRSSSGTLTLFAALGGVLLVHRLRRRRRD